MAKGYEQLKIGTRALPIFTDDEIAEAAVNYLQRVATKKTSPCAYCEGKGKSEFFIDALPTAISDICDECQGTKIELSRIERYILNKRNITIRWDKKPKKNGKRIITVEIPH